VGQFSFSSLNKNDQKEAFLSTSKIHRIEKYSVKTVSVSILLLEE
jgi:hypothetical protein